MKPHKHLLVALAVLAGLAASCHAYDPYRRVPPPTAAERALDPRPDLNGRPVVPGDALYEMEQFFRRHFPAHRPFVVRWTPLADPYLGRTYPSGPMLLPGGLDADGNPPDPSGELVIEIRDDLPHGWIARDVLLHEYAHVLSWDAVESGHGAVWASYFGQLYRATRGERPATLFYKFILNLCEQQEK